MDDPWNPDQYHRFADQRRQPFDDLVKLIHLPPGRRLLDLGCGTGELTHALHTRLQARETLGVDSSANMLAKARPLAGDGLRFELLDVAKAEFPDQYDLVFSNAALQWIPDHPTLLARLKSWLAPDGQLAIQLPDMEEHVTHAAARNVAARTPYLQLLGGFHHHLEALPPQCYAQRLFELGFRQQHVRLQIYGHLLPSTDALVDWMRGTLLTCYQRRLDAKQFENFVAEYRQAICDELGPQSPFFFPFRRILIWARS
jgi:trans-aconitate 2-methyltransferase